MTQKSTSGWQVKKGSLNFSQGSIHLFNKDFPGFSRVQGLELYDGNTVPSTTDKTLFSL